MVTMDVQKRILTNFKNVVNFVLNFMNFRVVSQKFSIHAPGFMLHYWVICKIKIAILQ